MWEINELNADRGRASLRGRRALRERSTRKRRGVRYGPTSASATEHTMLATWVGPRVVMAGTDEKLRRESVRTDL